MLSRFKKKMIASVLAFSLLIGALIAPAAAFAANSKTGPVVATQVTVVSGSNAAGGYQTNNLISNVIKKAITAALRYGGSYLGKILEKLSPSAGKFVTKYSTKIADFLDSITNWQENIIATGLVAIGIPPAEAYEIAKVVVWLAGI
ncbi:MULTISPECIES: hypothetical protein [Bacillales]|uniref:hypothetical protein n=1 Tax=Bacillales TaxID=1385 RepID=UPI0006A7AC99|nr:MULTISPECIES: hypothetical protein [Bacillales]OBZ12957.1 hypothetical protein A7975_08635 [Bacillus sp. FJAT-26390]